MLPRPDNLAHREPEVGLGIIRNPSANRISEWPDDEHRHPQHAVALLQVGSRSVPTYECLVLVYPIGSLVEELDYPLGVTLGDSSHRPECLA